LRSANSISATGAKRYEVIHDKRIRSSRAQSPTSSARNLMRSLRLRLLSARTQTRGWVEVVLEYAMPDHRPDGVCHDPTGPSSVIDSSTFVANTFQPGNRYQFAAFQRGQAKTEARWLQAPETVVRSSACLPDSLRDLTDMDRAEISRTWIGIRVRKISA
jgi:hypothetical protein